MGLQHFFNFKVRGVPLWVIGVCGLAGILVDIDHPVADWLGSQHYQALHLPLAIISCLVLGGVSACCGGLYLKLVLTKKRRDHHNKA